jgi:hypothetical protein
VAVIAAGAITWRKVLSHRLFPKRFGVVEAGSVYRCGWLPQWRADKVLSDNGIDVIIDMTHEIPPGHAGHEKQAAELQAAERLGIEHKRFELAGDGTGDLTSYVRALETMAEAKKAGKQVLVHCAAGSQRTGGVIAYYRLFLRNDPPETVYAELKKYGGDSEPDSPLMTYLNGNMKELAQRLAERGVIAGVPKTLPVLGPSGQ